MAFFVLHAGLAAGIDGVSRSKRGGELESLGIQNGLDLVGTLLGMFALYIHRNVTWFIFALGSAQYIR